MIQTTTPKVELNGIEYLLLSIQSNPGKSQRWHLRRKHMYQHGRPDWHNGGSGCGYFISPSYRNVVWFDSSVSDVRYGCNSSVNETFSSPSGWTYSGYYQAARKSKSASMHLTATGWYRANEARIKIGLSPLPIDNESEKLMIERRQVLVQHKTA